MLILYLLFCNKFNRPILHAAPFCSLYHLKKCKKKYIHLAYTFILSLQVISATLDVILAPGRKREKERKRERNRHGDTGKKHIGEGLTFRVKQEVWRHTSMLLSGATRKCKHLPFSNSLC